MDKRLPRPASLPLLLVPILLACLSAPDARILNVGPGKAYAAPCAAAAAVKDGDTVEIDPGIYSGDVCAWTASDLVLRATGPYAHLRADGKQAGGKGTWILQGKNTMVENIEFSGASVPDQNGAGIRQEGENLTVRHCFFHGNENGILTGSSAGDVVIEYSQFDDNGFGDGYTHNMYIGNTRSFTLRYCFTHRAKAGHDVKTRALSNRILYNRISDEADGTASYEIDMPDGGSAVVLGNVVQQGPKSGNSAILTYGEESLKNPEGFVYIAHNTFVNDKESGTFIRIASGAKAEVWNNLFVGAGTPVSGPADTAGNCITDSPGFVDRAGYDYRLTSASPAIDKGSEVVRMISAYPLAPAFEYRHPADRAARGSSGALDAGAYEFMPGSAIGIGWERDKSRSGTGRLPGFAPAWIVRPAPEGSPAIVNPLGRRAPPLLLEMPEIREVILR